MLGRQYSTTVLQSAVWRVKWYPPIRIILRTYH